MTAPAPRVADAVGRLRLALERTAESLARPDLDALLAGEQEIEAALAQMTEAAPVSREERQAVRAEIEAAASALMRCRRLGAALSDFVRTSFDAQGRGSDYGPRQPETAGYTGHVVNARV